MSTVHFYPDSQPPMLVSRAVSWLWAHELLMLGQDFHTNQMSMLEEREILAYDRIVIHHATRPDIVLTRTDYGWDCSNTDKEIREAHNLFHLWKAGELDPPPEGWKCLR